LTLNNEKIPVIIANYPSFDRRMYETWGKKFIKNPIEIIWINSINILKQLKKENTYKLDIISKKYLQKIEESNNAKGDIMNLKNVLLKFSELNENDFYNFVIKNLERLKYKKKLNYKIEGLKIKLQITNKNINQKIKKKMKK
jgi:hypothetical protein